MKTKTYFTSDWHLFHAKSIEFDQRPFRDIEHMHKVLINNFNATVKPNSITYFLGDLGMGTTTELGEIIRQLNGTKIMVLGNHDKSGIDRYIEMGFSAALNGISFNIGSEPITASHCPLLDTYREDTTNMQGVALGEPWHGNARKKHRLYSFPNFGQFHLHGHIHSRPEKITSTKILGRQYDIGVPANNYTPVSLSTIESWVSKTLKKESENKA